MTNLSTFRRRSSRRKSSGQALVELSVISIVMLLLFGTVLDFGRLFYSQITVENTARAGVLVAARAPTSYTGDCPLPAADTNKIGCAIGAESRGSGVTVGSAEVTVTCEDLSGTTLGQVPGPPSCDPDPQPDFRSRVTISKQFTFLMPLLSAILGNSLTMTASVAADQESVPADATVLPSPTPGPTPTPSPTPTPTPTPTATPTPTPVPTPSPTPTPCAAGFAPMPDLVEGATAGSTETVAQARAEWLTAGFDPARFIPGSGSTNKTVLTQTTTPGDCYNVATASVTVTHS
ncbi:MAG: pilus assembly protein [Candidatus Limnocylindrales bacterium]|nr:pilus assembly protein [Candidatus Limnocylindrales bacterium]